MLDFLSKLLYYLSNFAKIRRMAFEINIIEFLQAGRNPFFDTAFLMISKIGSALGIVGLCIFFLIFNRRMLGWFLFSYGFVNVAVRIVKGLVERVRPYNLVDTVLCLGDKVEDFSFPSGHTAAATAIAIFLGFFLFAHFKSRGMRVGIVMSLCVYVGLVAISRMYLGMHYLTDVLAGFAISAVICALCITFMWFYYRSKMRLHNVAGR